MRHTVRGGQTSCCDYLRIFIFNDSRESRKMRTKNTSFLLAFRFNLFLIFFFFAVVDRIELEKTTPWRPNVLLHPAIRLSQINTQNFIENTLFHITSMTKHSFTVDLNTNPFFSRSVIQLNYYLKSMWTWLKLLQVQVSFH